MNLSLLLCRRLEGGCEASVTTNMTKAYSHTWDLLASCYQLLINWVLLLTHFTDEKGTNKVTVSGWVRTWTWARWALDSQSKMLSTSYFSLAKGKELLLLPRSAHSCGHCRFHPHPTLRSPLLVFHGTPYQLGSFLLLCWFSSHLRLPEYVLSPKIRLGASTLESPFLFLNLHPSIQSAHLPYNML